MTKNQELLSKVVGDFDTLYRAYEQAGLLAEHASSEAASKLLGSGDDIYRFKREFFLAEALIRNRVGRLVYGDNRLRHLAVFGGNNVGKSTVINILAAENLTDTSPEGGHASHAQAFFAVSIPGGSRRLFGANPYSFRRFHSSPTGALECNRFDQYGEGALSSHVLPEGVVLWDMPDCDATESQKYMNSVVEAVTLADALVYVTSVERYAMEHMVEWVFLLHEAGIDFVQLGITQLK